jgi:hypothetical protein
VQREATVGLRCAKARLGADEPENPPAPEATVTNPRFGLFFATSALVQLAVALRASGWWAVLPGWLGLSLAQVAVAYLFAGPRVLGKRADGTLHPVAWLWGLPFFALQELATVVRRLRRAEPAWNEVAPGLYLGRRCQALELPPGTRWVVDLTAEFAEPRVVREGHTYRALPTLDGCAMDPGPFALLVEELRGTEGPVFVHCAVGHGRSATVLAAVLLARGLARDVDDAEQMMQRARPLVRLGRRQRALLTAWRRNAP